MPGFNKIVNCFEDAMDGLADGMTVIAGGFGVCGIPEGLIKQIRNMRTKNLTVVSNNCGIDGVGLGTLLERRQIRKMIASYVGDNELFETQLISGDLDVELTPQGTLAEKIRAGGAGIPAFYTATGYGTPVGDGKEVREYDGRRYILEESIVGDFAIIKAWKADRYGNAVYRNTAQNFNPIAATAGKVTVLEVEHVVPVGAIDPNHIHTPGIYVDRVIQGELEKPIEKITTTKV